MIEFVCENLGSDNYRDMLVNNLLTEIMNKWPVVQWRDPNFKIQIQQDGVGGHC